jgi:hypothetical protein
MGRGASLRPKPKICFPENRFRTLCKIDRNALQNEPTCSRVHAASTPQNPSCAAVIQFQSRNSRRAAAASPGIVRKRTWLPPSKLAAASTSIAAPSCFQIILASNAVPFPLFFNPFVLARASSLSPCPPSCDSSSFHYSLLFASCRCIFHFAEIPLFNCCHSAHHQLPTPCSCLGIHTARVQAGARCVWRAARDGLATQSEDQPTQVESCRQVGAAHGLGAGADAAPLLLKEDGGRCVEDHSRRQMERSEQQRKRENSMV